MGFGAQVEKRVVELYDKNYHIDFNNTCKVVFCEVKAVIKTIKTVKDIVNFWLDHGYTPQQRREAGKRRRAAGINEYRKLIEHLVDTNAGLYLDEIARHVEQECSKRFSEVAISRALRRYGYSLRTLFTRAEQRDEFKTMMCLARLGEYDPERFIFVDETHQDEKQARRRRGWAKRGRVPTVFEPLSNKRYTVIAAFNLQGFVTPACEVIELEPHKGVDGARFLQWVEEKLVPELGSYLAGARNSVVVLDNASVHIKELDAVVEAIRAKGAVVEFLSPYSPDLNPIEEAFSKVKKAVRRMRSLYNANPKVCIRTAIGWVTSEDAHGYYRHSGYRVPDLAAKRKAAAAVAGLAGATLVVGAMLARKRRRLCM